MSIVDDVAASGGVARHYQLRAAGHSRRRIDSAVRGGELRAVGRGAVALPTAPAEVMAAAALGARVTCVTGLALMGVPVLRAPSRLHVATANSRSYQCHAGGVRLHRVEARIDSAVAVSTMVRHLATCVTGDALVVTLDGVLHRGLMTMSELAALPVRSGRSWRAALDRCDARAESAPESLARLALAGLGVSVWPQAEVDRVGRVDFLIDNRLVVEVDGRAHHTDREAFSADRRRDRLLVEQGLAVARFAATDVLRDPSAVATHCARRLGVGT